MNKLLFQKSGLYQVIKDTNAPDNDEFDYSKHYVDFFEFMSTEGALAYDKLENDAKTVLDNGGTRGEALSRISEPEHVANLTVDNMEKFYEFVHTYTK